jgi:hypothetical protein
MKKAVSYKFTNAEVSVDNEQYIITETSKDDTKIYNFSSILNSLAGKTVAITIQESLDVPSEE